MNATHFATSAASAASSPQLFSSPCLPVAYATTGRGGWDWRPGASGAARWRSGATRAGGGARIRPALRRACAMPGRNNILLCKVSSREIPCISRGEKRVRPVGQLGRPFLLVVYCKSCSMKDGNPADEFVVASAGTLQNALESADLAGTVFTALRLFACVCVWGVCVCVCVYVCVCVVCVCVFVCARVRVGWQVVCVPCEGVAVARCKGTLCHWGPPWVPPYQALEGQIFMQREG